MTDKLHDGIELEDEGFDETVRNPALEIDTYHVHLLDGNGEEIVVKTHDYSFEAVQENLEALVIPYTWIKIVQPDTNKELLNKKDNK